MTAYEPCYLPQKKLFPQEKTTKNVRRYCGVFGYADDLALVSPTIHGLTEIIKICEDYACEFDIMFNPKESKLMCYNVLSDTKPIIILCNQLVQVVDSEIYLG